MLLLPLLAVVLPLLRECFAVSLPKSLLCVVKTEESPSRSHEQLRPRQMNDYIVYSPTTTTSSTSATSSTSRHRTCPRYNVRSSREAIVLRRRPVGCDRCYSCVV
ncbi:hypothetical protein BRADI_4g13528v3 [Brachypodium distachyon]|uniref:Secreted protein n=1 Tax=Brachypodium distachyon TaxID=15368 RepID=A0A2K2CMJ7_BRADI|nr:hypothetical protein BRADI_4g13528v3 [Brachypodium distachyon]